MKDIERIEGKIDKFADKVDEGFDKMARRVDASMDKMSEKVDLLSVNHAVQEEKLENHFRQHKTTRWLTVTAITIVLTLIGLMASCIGGL